MIENMSFLILYGLPGFPIISLLGVLLTYFYGKKPQGKWVRALCLWPVLFCFLLSLGLLLMLSAHIYLTYALISAAITLVSFLYIGFYRTI